MWKYREALPTPIDRFYMYYAPHTSHAMGLATAPHPEGPWTPYAGNPILRREQVQGIRDHLSSPELVYRPDHPDAPFWLYFHGMNLPPGRSGQRTCLATSPDGLTWTQYGDAPVLTATLEQSGDYHTAAYVRLFRRPGDPWWYGLYKSQWANSLARSRDGIEWEHWPRNPLIKPDPEAGDHEKVRHVGLLLEDDVL